MKHKRTTANDVKKELIDRWVMAYISNALAVVSDNDQRYTIEETGAEMRILFRVLEKMFGTTHDELVKIASKEFTKRRNG